MTSPVEPSAQSEGRIAVIGDLHGSWDEVDVEYFNRSNYELLLFVGDLGAGTLRADLSTARSIARLARPALVLPGNNDAVHIAQVAAEFVHQKGLIQLMSIGHGRRSQALSDALGDVQLCGYSLHSVRVGGVALDIITCRPHSMGGPTLSFAPFLASRYGVASLEESAKRLCELIDVAKSEHLLFLAHNGPAGLGAEPGDIWGCDFKSGGGDWGDPDLEAAIEYARNRRKRILAVVAGHMHLRVRGGGERPWRLERNGVLYLNSARVPRIFPTADGTRRHHLALTLAPEGLKAEEVLVE